MQEYAQDQGHNEKRHDFQQDGDDVHTLIRQAGDEGEGHDTQDVVDKGGAQNGVARAGGELAHLPEGLHRDAHRGGGEDDADKDVFQKVLCAAVEGGGQKEAARQRGQDAAQGDHKGRTAGFFELVDIRLQAGGEHKDNHAQLRHLVDEGGLLEKPQKCGAEYQSGHQRAHHLGHGEALGDDAEELGADENERQIQKEMIGFHAEEHLDSKNGAAGPPPGKGNSQGRKEA